MNSSVEEHMSLNAQQIDEILERVSAATMVPASAVRFTIEQCLAVIANDSPGVIVECGVWKGGCSLAMLLAQKRAFGHIKRPVYLLDSFQGLPPAQVQDGPLAIAWQADKASPIYFDNCDANLQEVVGLIQEAGFSEGEYQIVPGWFETTVPQLRRDLATRGIALLRLDADWFESTLLCLEQLLPIVADQGIVIIDDYYAWDGCARAVHTYFGVNNLAYRLRSLEHFYGAYFVKNPARRSADRL